MTTRRLALLPVATGALVGLLVLLAYVAGAAAQGQPPDLSAYLPPGFGVDDVTAFDVARYSGALWIAAGVLIVVGGRHVRARLSPSGADEPPAGTWRAKLLLIAGIVIAVGAAVVDRATAGGTTGAILSTAFAAAWGAYRAGDDPPRGSKRAESLPAAGVVTGTIVSLLLVGSLTACARPTPSQPHPTRDVLRELAAEILGAGVETICDPAIAAELRPDADHPVARAVFDAAAKRLCPAVP